MNKTLILLAAVSFGWAAASQAATVQTVSVQNGGAIDPSCGVPQSEQAAGPEQISVVVQNTQSGCRVDVSAGTLGGGLTVTGTAGAFEGSTSAVRIRATATQSTAGLMLTPLFDVNTYTGPTYIGLSANIAFDGFLDAEVAQGVPFVRSAAAFLRADATITGKSGPNLFDTARNTRTYENSVGVINSPGEDLAFDLINAMLLPTISHDWRAPFSLAMSLTGTAGAFGSGDTKATGVFDSGNTLSFSKTGPAFLLPDGFTISAPELNIVNNRWIDPRVQVSPVPLPAGVPLLLAAVGSLALARRAGLKRRNLKRQG
ncbi:MAG: VPLPA-CTERM sorting domain-containing protein [Roseobacter sp.]